jgi:hypothetical protein
MWKADGAGKVKFLSKFALVLPEVMYSKHVSAARVLHSFTTPSALADSSSG